MDAYKQAIKFLAFKDYSSFEIAKKLLKKGFSKEEIEEAIERLKNEKILNDYDTLIRYVRNRLKKNAWGKNALYIFLKKKGASEDIILKILSDITEDTIIENAILHIKKKKKYENLKKLLTYLKTHGFNEYEAEKITENFIKE